MLEGTVGDLLMVLFLLAKMLASELISHRTVFLFSFYCYCSEYHILRIKDYQLPGFTIQQIITKHLQTEESLIFYILF
jgi:hypothetical protein